MTGSARPIREIVGEGIRATRERYRVRQEDVATHARAFGLPWDRSRVAAIERGEKPVSAEALALLPVVLSKACGTPVTLADLIPAHATLDLSDLTSATGAAVISLYGGRDPLTLRPGELWRESVAAETDRLNETAEKSLTIWRRLRALDVLATVTDEDVAQAHRQVGVADQRAGRRLDEPPLVIAVLSRALWSRSLADERDRLVSERTDAGDDPGRLRALRGRVTRDLTNQLRDEITRRAGGGHG